MNEQVDNAPRRESQQELTLLSALNDIGFVSWLFAAVVGGPSVLSLVQYTFVDLQFTVFIQWIVDGYNELLKILGAVFEPTLHWIIGSIERIFGLDLELQPYWRPLFVLLLIFVSANTRTLLGDGYRWTAAVFVVVTGIATLFGCAGAALISSKDTWWLQGTAAALPILALFLGLVAAYAVSSLVFGFSQPYRKPLTSYAARGFSLALAAFVLAAGISFLFSDRFPAGVFTVYCGMLLYGLYWLLRGFVDEDAPEVRFGLRMIGGYAFAALVVGIDLILQLV